MIWETRGLKIDNSEFLSQLLFADDIFITANTPYELQQMLHELADKSKNQCLKMNKVMMETTQQYNMSIILKSRTSSTWDRYTAPDTAMKTRRYKEESRPDGHYSSSTATSSRATL